MSVVAKYALLQIPGIVGFGCVLAGAVRWADLPPRLALMLLGLWLLKDLVMFRFVRVAYEPTSPGGADAMVGARGVARRRVDPDGKVQVGPEIWNAVLAAGSAPIADGARVRVREVRGLTLVVEPDAEP